MRKKYTSNMYLRGVSDFDLVKIKRENQNRYIVIKKINKIDEPFMKKDKPLIDNGYYIMEVTELDKNYNTRIFMDNKLNVITYYFDISLENGISKENVPYYDDLYLDVICNPEESNVIKIEDENELEEALNLNKITKVEYDLANQTCKDLIQEINNNQNQVINMDKKSLITKYFRD